jgi:hypothetical protein
LAAQLVIREKVVAANQIAEEKAEEKTAKAADAATKTELTRMAMQQNGSNLQCSHEHISHLVHNE